MRSTIPLDLRRAIELQSGRVITAERPRGEGGASREGAEVTLRADDGAEGRCYLTWDKRVGDPSRIPFFERERAVLAALSGPLAASGVKVAKLVASVQSHLALCSEFVPGNDRFAAARDKPALICDFMAQLTNLHRIDARHPALARLGDAAVPPSRAIADRIEQLKQQNLAAAPDPILQLALRWLAQNIPQDRGPAVVLHGDAGPGNFLFENDRVAALVDWELTHLGDPMEDLAQIWVRSLIQPFGPMRNVFDAYVSAGGLSIDLPRIKYHRLFFQLGFMVAAHAAQAGVAALASGTALVLGAMHRRIIVTSLAEQTGANASEPALPECPARSNDGEFVAALDGLRHQIVPGLTSQQASAKAKSLARMIKIWRQRDRFGAAFEAQELGEIDTALGTHFPDLPTARAALGQVIGAGRLDFERALQLCQNAVARETRLMADAMGALATAQYEYIG
jgi:aminoglycoside phosphotransferase